MQEGVAVGMADGYARASGKVGFVSLHIDSGLANGLSLLNDSNFSGTPLVVTAANKDVRKLAEGRSDLARMCEPFTKWSVEITHAEQFPSVMRRAFTAARTPPTGPVFVGFSGNALEDEAEVELVPSRAAWSAARPDRDAIGETAAYLAGAEHPVLIVGDRVGEDDACRGSRARGRVDRRARVLAPGVASQLSHWSPAVYGPVRSPQSSHSPGSPGGRRRVGRRYAGVQRPLLSTGRNPAGRGHAHSPGQRRGRPSVALSRPTSPSWPRPRWDSPSLARPSERA